MQFGKYRDPHMHSSVKDHVTQRTRVFQSYSKQQLLRQASGSPKRPEHTC
jgi:hypothetical protein